MLAGLAAGRAAISAGRDGPVLLRVDGELVACGADGASWPGRTARAEGPRRPARFAGASGYHRLTDPAGATLALTL